MAFQAACPSCGAEVIFKSGSSVVRVCDFCHSVVARTDRGVEDVGKVADVVESGSPLEVGLRGVCRGVAFELTGRAQLSHAAGGMWDEWYAALADGRWGWLSESQGRFHLTFQIQVPEPQSLPAFDALQLGQSVEAIPAQIPLVVAERGEARMLAAEGEIPYHLTPGATYRYADLSGREGVFGTLDYGEEPPSVFVGREVSLEELGLVVTPGRTREREPRNVSASRLNCPHCAGPLELRAPDLTERVTCPNCGSLLDVNQGALRYLKTLTPKGNAPSIPHGATAEFEGQPFTVIGFMSRSVEFEGVRYFWQEYLLYNPSVGFRWLVESDGHWSYVVTVPPGEVSEATDSKKAFYGGKSFKIFQDAAARVEYVQGEFYWKVSVGETVRAVDFVSAPEMLSKEVSGGYGHGQRQSGGIEAEEINWSRGTYVPVKEIEKKFNVELPKPHTVAPNQPFRNKSVYLYWLLFTFAALVVGVSMLATGSRNVVFNQNYKLQSAATPSPTPKVITLPDGSTMTLPERQTASVPPPVAPLPNLAAMQEGTQVIFSDAFELKGRQNIKVTGAANVSNNWLSVAGDLINEETGLVQSFDLPIEHYFGTDGGESWSEGGQQETAYLSSLPAGRYTLRLEAQWEKWNQAVPPQLSVRVEQGVPRVLNLVLVLIALAVVPLFVAIRHASFESKRWADSAFNPSGTEGSSDDEE
ncbi:MAG: DUF4178 domain-containing protein [Acidobacteria bacterium]|nr:DUF4178 domain-containing protein [Acidobacteriota bacterium]